MVRDFLEEDRRFMLRCSSRAYDVVCLGVRDRYRYPVAQPESNEPLFKIPKAVVLECERGASEHLVRINKIDAMILEVLEPLSLVPFEPHLRSVYTDRPERNRVSCCPMTPRFSGGALPHVPWQFMHDRPLQLLVCSASGTHRDKLGPMGYS